jgi:hypothetical protein
MTGSYSIAFKQKMLERVTGKDALSPLQLSRKTGATAELVVLVGGGA